MSEETLRYIFSFLGGGVVAAGLHWVRATWMARRQREADRIRDQLRNLYGPLFFFTSQNDHLFNLTNDISSLFEYHFGGEWSDDPTTQDRLAEQAQGTVDLQNDYVRRAVENNKRVMELLEENWHLVHEDDIAVFSKFQVDYTRFQVEVKEQRRRDVPLSIHMELGDISPSGLECGVSPDRHPCGGVTRRVWLAAPRNRRRPKPRLCGVVAPYPAHVTSR